MNKYNPTKQSTQAKVIDANEWKAFREAHPKQPSRSDKRKLFSTLRKYNINPEKH